MRTKHAFGLTPWGRYFIDAMERLADEGRLARGRSYAGNGAVFELDVDGGTVKAKVEGNYAPYYRVLIQFKQLPAKSAAVVQAAFDEDPLLSARLAAGDLPESLIERLEQKGISLVPRSWSEIQRSCTCPDYGDPCKHQAAVYYLIAQEIDRDPLVLFRLLGIELSKTQGTAAVVPPPMNPGFVEPWPDPPFASSVPGVGSDPLAGIPSLSTYTVAIPALLPPTRGMAPFDLRVMCRALYIEAASRIPRVIEYGNGHTLRPPPKMDEAEARLFAASRFDVFTDGRIEVSIATKKHGKLGVLACSLLFAACDQREGSASYRFLRSFFSAIRSIAVAGAFFPDVLASDGRFRVVWKPARFVAEVEDLLNAVARIAPSPHPHMRASSVPDARSTVEAMAVSFLTEAVASIGFAPSTKREAEHPVSRALFSGQDIECVAPGERNLPVALDTWLSVYDLIGQHLPLELKIEAGRSQAGEELFRLSAGVMIQEEAERGSGHLVPLKNAGRLEPGVGSKVLAFVALLSNYVQALGALATQPWVDLSYGELAHFVVEAAPLLQRFGVAVVLPKSLRKLLTPRAAIVSAGSARYTTYLDLATAFTFDWAVAIGDDRLSAAEFAELVDAGLRLVRWRGQWVRIDPSEAARLLSRVSGRATLDAGQAVRLALSGEVDIDGALSDAVQRLIGAGKKVADEAPIPVALLASLRPYQERGYRWMISTWERGFGCLLADDMGLGKTVQTIAAILYLKEEGKLEDGALVCAPASLLFNWEREIRKFAPSLTVCPYYGTGRRLDKADVTLSSYETWIRDQKKLGAIAWSLLVLDEAHYIKNPQSKRAKAVNSIRASRRLALTGTPVENNLAEFWSIFNFVLPGYLGTLARFSEEFRKPIELERSEETASTLRRVTAPFIMRRLKTDATIVADLPEKVVVDEYASLTAEQAALYEAVASEGLSFIANAGPEERLGAVLALIIALKQVSNHPRNYDGQSPGTADRSGKARLLLAVLDSAFEAGERVLVFSQYVTMIDILARIIRDDLGVEPYILHGGLTRKRRDEQVERFQTERGPGVFLISLKAGGVGLNLTAATRVVHYDLWFNPAVENQATDRAFRIGQTRNVFVHRLITRDTIEEKIDAMISSKRGLSELTVRAGESWLADLNNEELRELVALR